MHTNKFEFIANKLTANEGMRYDEAQLLYHLKIGLDNIDRERDVERLKREVERGTYAVRGEEVAEKMLCAEHGVPAPVSGCPFCRVRQENIEARQTAEQAAAWQKASRHWQGEDFRQEPGMEHAFHPPPSPQLRRRRDWWMLKQILFTLAAVGMIVAVFAAQEKIEQMKQEQKRMEGRP